LCAVWDIITKCNEMQSKDEDVSKYIEELEKTKGNPFYNENKRKKKVSVDEDNDEQSFGKNSKIYNPNKSIELDF
jgi:hypothetical protein